MASDDHFNPMVTLKGKNGSVTFDKRTHVGVRDSKGFVKVFAKSERSAGTVNNRLYGFYNVKRFGEGKRKAVAEKPFKASVVPFEPDLNVGFKPFVSKE